MKTYTILDYLFQSHLILFNELFKYIWNLKDPRFYAEYEPSLFELFIRPFLFFLTFLILFWVLWVFLKKKIKLKEIWKWKHLFLYFFPWVLWWIIWAPLVFWLLHRKIDLKFFIHSVLSVTVYLLWVWVCLILL